MGVDDSSAAMTVVSAVFLQALHVNYFGFGSTPSFIVGSHPALVSCVACLDTLLGKLACIQHISCSHSCDTLVLH